MLFEAPIVVSLIQQRIAKVTDAELVAANVTIGYLRQLTPILCYRKTN